MTTDPDRFCWAYKKSNPGLARARAGGTGEARRFRAERMDRVSTMTTDALFEEEELLARDLIDYLLKEIKTVSEAQCKEHGSPNSPPALTLTLVSLIAAESVGRLTARKGVEGIHAIREFLYAVGDAAGDERYRHLAGPLFGTFRNGIAHVFLPLRVEPDGCKIECRLCWLHENSRSQCFEWLLAPEGKLWAASNRREHLAVGRFSNGTRFFTVCPQILALDVYAYLDQVKAALISREAHIRRQVRKNFRAWNGKANLAVEKWISDDEMKYLFI